MRPRLSCSLAFRRWDESVVLDNSTGLSVPVKYSPRREGDPPTLNADSSANSAGSRSSWPSRRSWKPPGAGIHPDPMVTGGGQGIVSLGRSCALRRMLSLGFIIYPRKAVLRGHSFAGFLNMWRKRGILTFIARERVLPKVLPLCARNLTFCGVCCRAVSQHENLATPSPRRP
jgi:hypothetical protein